MSIQANIQVMRVITSDTLVVLVHPGNAVLTMKLRKPLTYKEMARASLVTMTKPALGVARIGLYDSSKHVHQDCWLEQIGWPEMPVYERKRWF